MTSSPTRRALRSTFPAEQAANDPSNCLTEWLGRTGPSALYRTCGSCRHMAHAPEPARCGKYSMTPPVEVVLEGCDSYEDDAEIPL